MTEEANGLGDVETESYQKKLYDGKLSKEMVVSFPMEAEESF